MAMSFDQIKVNDKTELVDRAERLIDDYLKNHKRTEIESTIKIKFSAFDVPFPKLNQEEEEILAQRYFEAGWKLFYIKRRFFRRYEVILSIEHQPWEF